MESKMGKVSVWNPRSNPKACLILFLSIAGVWNTDTTEQMGRGHEPLFLVSSDHCLPTPIKTPLVRMLGHVPVPTMVGKGVYVPWEKKPQRWCQLNRTCYPIRIGQIQVSMTWVTILDITSLIHKLPWKGLLPPLYDLKLESSQASPHGSRRL